jgi:hypothetical protein
MDDHRTPEQRLAADNINVVPYQPRRGRTFGRLQLLSDADALKAPAREYLLDGILGRGEFSLWWGAPKSKKSFVVLHIARAIAQGHSVFGREVQQCPVVYVAAEGGTGLPKRIQAMHRRHGPAEGFYYIAQRIDLHDPEADLSALIEAVRAIGAGLIVLGTKHRVTPGADENSSRDGGVFAGHIDRIREETGAHVAVVHHAGRNGEHPRGTNSLDAAIDTNIRITAQGGTVTATVEEAKDDPDGLALAFQAFVVALPPDQRGRPQSTLLLEEQGPATGATSESLSPRLRTALRFLHDVAAREGRPLPAQWCMASDLRGVPEDRWRQECESRRLTNSESPKNRRDVTTKAMNELRDCGRVSMRDGWVWAVRPLPTGGGNHSATVCDKTEIT